MWHRFQLWVFQRYCGFRGHPTVIREWEWTIAAPAWTQRTVWTCVRCGQDLPPEDVRTLPRKATAPPSMTAALDQLMILLQSRPEEFSDVRLRARGR